MTTKRPSNLRPVTSTNQLRRAQAQAAQPAQERTRLAPKPEYTPPEESNDQMSHETAAQLQQFLQEQHSESNEPEEETTEPSESPDTEEEEDMTPNDREVMELAQQLQMRGPYDSDAYRKAVMAQSEKLDITEAITGRAQRKYVINEHLSVTVQQVFSGEELLIRYMMSDALNQMEQYYQALSLVRTLAVALVSINDIQISSSTNPMKAYTEEEINASVKRLSTIPRNLITLVGTVHAWHVGEVQKVLTPASIKNG